MRRALALAVLLALVPALSAAQGPLLTRAQARITTQTTTTLAAAVTGVRLAIYSLSICVDAGGATTGFAIQDSTPTNLVGTNIVYAVGAGSCITWRLRATPTPRTQDFALAASGTSIQIVTTVGNGPSNVTIEYAK